MDRFVTGEAKPRPPTPPREELFRAETDEAVIDRYTGEFLPEERAEDWSAGARVMSRWNGMRVALFRARRVVV